MFTMNIKYKILLATLGLIGIYFLTKIKPEKGINKNDKLENNLLNSSLSQNDNDVNNLFQPINPTKPTNSTINPKPNVSTLQIIDPTIPDDIKKLILSGQLLYIDGNIVQANNGVATSQSDNDGWVRLDNLIKLSNNPAGIPLSERFGLVTLGGLLDYDKMVDEVTREWRNTMLS